MLTHSFVELGLPAEPDLHGPQGSGRAIASRWVILSTFDPQGRSSESTVEQVRAYRAAGFFVLVVDTSAEPSEARRSDWEQEATQWFRRVNNGYDFGSFKAGLLHLTQQGNVRTGESDVLITNDSCFGPFIPLQPIIEGFDRFPLGERRVFGMTDSVQEIHHIQSYWIYFRSDVLHLALDFFFDRMTDASNRDEAIAMGELALGRFLLSSNCKIEVVCPVHATVAHLAYFNSWFASTIELVLRRLLKRWKYNRAADTQCLRHLLHLPEKLQYFNPIVLFGVQLHQLRALPFVKKSMLRENVYQDPAIPTGIDDPASLTNADVMALLR